MKYIAIAAISLVLLPSASMAQQPPSPPAAVGAPSPAAAPVPAPAPSPAPDLGKWWKNSQVVRSLELNDGQVKQIEQAFLEHRKRLSELRLELNRQEYLLQSFLNASQLDEKKTQEQIAQVAAARGKLELENTNMMLAFRRVLSGDQWKKLEEIRRSSRTLPTPPLPPPPPPPPPAPAPGAPAAPPAPPPPPPEVKEDGKMSSGEPIYAISGVVKPPVILFQPVPSYTPEAKEKKIEGIVIVQAVVDRDGVVRDIKVLRGIDRGLDESAVNTISKQWRFRPGTLNGKPVNVRANIEVSFRLY